jgi:hypothetical protein
MGNAGQLSRLVYMDDSGSVQGRGLVIYGWVEVHPVQWAVALRHWLEVRKALWRDYSVPVTQELHGTKYVNGRDRISTAPPDRYVTDDGTVHWKDLGRDVAVRCLEALRDCEFISVGAVYREIPGDPKAYGQGKFDLYGDFVHQLDEDLIDADTYAMITMDGTDKHYREAHRKLKLARRHIIEDPSMHDSKISQWTQMADLVAYTTNLHLDRYTGNEFGWEWYRTYLSPLDPNELPRLLPPADTARPA